MNRRGGFRERKATAESIWFGNKSLIADHTRSQNEEAQLGPLDSKGVSGDFLVEEQQDRCQETPAAHTSRSKACWESGDSAAYGSSFRINRCRWTALGLLTVSHS